MSTAEAFKCDEGGTSYNSQGVRRSQQISAVISNTLPHLMH